jgi:hypothetical protein
VLNLSGTEAFTLMLEKGFTVVLGTGPRSYLPVSRVKGH